MQLRKLLLLSLTGLLCTCQLSNAQRIGVKGGLNISSILSDASYYSNKPVVGLTFGVLTETSLILDEIIIQTGLIFSQKGGKYTTEYFDYATSGTSVTKGTKRLTYLDIPMLGGYKYKFEKITVYGTLGPSISIALSGHEKYTYEFLGSESESEFDIKFGGDDHRRIDVGFNLGGGIELYDKLQLGMNIQWGQTNIEASGTEQTNMMMQFSACYFFSDLNLFK